MKLVENGKIFVNKPFAEVKASKPIRVDMNDLSVLH